jgi:taurine dioxygenase
MTNATAAAPAVVRSGALRSIKVEPMTCSIGALLENVSLADAARDDPLFAEIRSLLIKHKVLFLHGQDVSRADVPSPSLRRARDHPVAGSDPDHPGLVRIYKGPDSRNEQYENAWHSDTTWRECPQFGAVLRCTETPPVGGDMLWANMVEAQAAARARQDPDCRPARGTASRLPSVPQCRSRSGWR